MHFAGHLMIGVDKTVVWYFIMQLLGLYVL